MNDSLRKMSNDIFTALSHELRRKILLLLHQTPVLTYTQVMESVKISTGKLNYHLKLLEQLVMKNDGGAYMLTDQGRRAVSILQTLEGPSLSPLGVATDSREENSQVVLDAKAMEMLQEIRDKMNQDGWSMWAGTMTPERRRLKVAILSVVMGLMVFIGFAIFLEESSPNPEPTGGGAPWIIMVIIANALLMTFLGFFIYKKRKNTRV